MFPDFLDSPGQPAVTPTPAPGSAPPAPADVLEKANVAPSGEAGAAKPAAKPPSKEALANLQDFVGEFLDGVAPETKPGAKPASKPAAGKPAGQKPPAKPKAAPRAATPPPAPTATEIATATAKAVTEALRPPAPAGPATPPPVELDKTDTRTFTVLQHLEKTNPTEYKGVADKFRAAQVKSYAYQEKWEKDNPGRDFDPESPEHEDFRKSVEVPFDQDDFEEARVALAAERIVAERMKPLNQRQAEVDRAEALRQAQPVIAQHIGTSRKSFWGMMGDEFKEVVTDAGAVDGEKLKALVESDPINGIRLQSAVALDKEVPEIVKLLNDLAPVAKPTDAVYGIHKAINDFGFRVEQSIAAEAPENQLDGRGRPFLPTAKYYALPANQRESYWTLTPEVLIPLRAKHWADQAAAGVAAKQTEFDAMLRARGITPPARPQAAAAPAARNGGTAPPPEPDDEPSGKPASPSTGALPNAAARHAAHAPGNANPIVASLLDTF